MSNETMRTEPETAKLIPSRFFGSRLVFTKADIRIDCIVFIKKLLLLVSFKNRQRPLSGFEARTTQSRFSKKLIQNTTSFMSGFDINHFEIQTTTRDIDCI